MDIILIHGMWLDGSSWDKVVPGLEAAGHRTHVLTLPGAESQDADRSQVTRADWVDAVVTAIDAVDPADGKVVVVGHSAAGDPAYAAADVRADRVAHLVFLASEPNGASEGGTPWPAVNGEIGFPDWSDLDDEMIADLDDDQRAAMRDRAIPVPARAVSAAFELTNDARLDIPTTVVACEYSSDQLKEWLTQGEEGALELGRLRNLVYVDFNSGHWPQITRPDDVVRVISEAAERS